MRSPKFLLNNVLARALLAFAFLFVQQTAALHWLSHATEAARPKSATASAPLADHCDECLAFSALDATASTANAVALPFVAARHALLSAPFTAPSPAALRLAFRSRAPPIPS